VTVILVLVALVGLTVLGWCALMPREIGREDEPLTSIRLRGPDMEGLALRMSQRNQRPRPVRASRPAAAPPPPPMPEAPSAMGAPQPVLSQEPATELALPG
jgi:hypothetical protein